MIHFFDQTPESMTAWCARHDMPAYRARQILDWVYAKGVIDPALMSSLSKRDRQTLSAEMVFLSGQVAADQLASDGTRKLLIEWTNPGPAAPEPGAGLPVLREPAPRRTECVMIPTDDRATACISSQVGCPVGCRFCASGLGGLEGNLSAGRIVEQVWRLDRAIKDGMSDPGDYAASAPHRVTNVVFMGMGEPLANLSNIAPAIRSIASLWGMGISARRITVSTVGLPRAIEKFAEVMDLPVTLALSLHAPTDEIRRSLIPWAEFSTIQELLDSCRKWFEKTGREITLEYTLLRGVNDRPEHAAELARLARTLRANVNLIRYNEVAGIPFERPATEAVRGFQQVLRDRGVNAHIRRSRGRDIAAACGQLRRETAGSRP